MDFNSFKQAIEHQINHNLPGENAHSHVMPINRPFTSTSLASKPDYRKSAVGIVLYPELSTTNCVLIERPSYDGVHSGQISFPGGKMDLEDPHLEYTARRECFEEIDLPIESGQLIGGLTDVYIPVSNFLMSPFVFSLEERPILTPDEREVESIIEFDIFQLLEKDRLKTMDMKLGKGFTQKNVPYFDINGHVVWGATAMVLSEFREIIRAIR